MGDDVRCDYVEGEEIDDEEVFALMEEAFANGLIEPGDRRPVLHLFNGRDDLVFVLAGGGEGIAGRIAGGATLRLSPEVQRRLVARFAHWLAAN